MSVRAQYKAIMKKLSPIDADRVLPTWRQPDDAIIACFGRRDPAGNLVPPEERHLEIDRIVGFRPASRWRTVIFLSYENPMGASGGILAVIRRLPAEMRRVLEGPKQEAVANLIRLSPHHTKLRSRYAADQLTRVGDCSVHFDGRDIPVVVSKVAVKNDEWYLFGAEGFFEADGGFGGTDPYVYGAEDRSQRDGDQSRLLRDSLFAAKAVPAVLKVLDQTEAVVVHAQDWEFAAAALTVKEAIIDGTLKNAAVVLTLHNPYDHALSEDNLAKITSRCANCYWPAIGGLDRATVLTRMIPLLDAPVSVVSHQFATEMTTAPIQTGVFTRHLQGVLAYQGVIGVDNGAFCVNKGPPFSASAIRQAHLGMPKAILDEKGRKRKAMLRALAKYLDALTPESAARPDTRTIGTLTGGEGKPLVELDDDIPVFMMIGRLDPGQKGYDVCAHLIQSLPPGTARFVLTPMSSLAQDPSVSPFFAQLGQLAKDRLGDVVIFAHRMTEAYAETMAGATFGLWPSRYEPFGGATEFYANGTPVIAHAAGGLVQQVVGFQEAHRDATGFLYRDIPLKGVPRGVMEDEYVTAHEAMPGGRMQVPEYLCECASLTSTVIAAIEVFQNDKPEYGLMLANVGDMLDQLNWTKPVKDYLAWYEKAWQGR